MINTGQIKVTEKSLSLKALEELPEGAFCILHPRSIKDKPYRLVLAITVLRFSSHVIEYYFIKNTRLENMQSFTKNTFPEGCTVYTVMETSETFNIEEVEIKAMHLKECIPYANVHLPALVLE